MSIYNSMIEIIGRTPMIRVKNYEKKINSKAEIIVKLEMLNPTGSVKDRIAKEMIEEAERCGKLKTGSVIIEPTSGNTGIGLAAIAAVKGYRTIIVMPETMSEERRILMKLYGAEIVLTEGVAGMKGAIKRAEEIAAEVPDSFIPSQFENKSNPQAHLKTTGPEIWEDTEGEIDILIAGVGTGGTISGIGEYLKSKNTKIKVVAVEPKSSPVLSGGKAGAHKIQGIGAGFVPDILNIEIIDEIIQVKNEYAFLAMKELAGSEGIFAGISSGAALYAARLEAEKEENTGKKIVVILPDTGQRYLSMRDVKEDV